MRILFIFLSMLFAFHSHAGVHTLARAVQAIERNQVNTQLLVYKVKSLNRERENQQWQIYLGADAFHVAPLFRHIRQMEAVGASSSFKNYLVRKFPEMLDRQSAVRVLEQMYSDPNLEFAYFEPRLQDAVALERMNKPKNASAPEIQDYESKQFYLNTAPEGVDARYGWKLPGGTGKGVRIIDVETGWHIDHFEFASVFYDNGKNNISDHGTAVWGQVAGQPNGKGITGIAYDVEWGIAGNWFAGFDGYPETIASVIEHAVLQLGAGDLLIIEQHAPLVDDYGPIEYFEPVFKVLQLATLKGVHCVAAAGNGYSNLDHAKYEGMFDLAVRDSGCVLVGAVDSPNGSRARQRSDFSNYGMRVDAFGYGEDVVTAGYGDLFNGRYQDKLAHYTSYFSGTSSATPIVAGAVASVLGIAKHRGKTITPAEMRKALRETGTIQQGPATENIGKMPDIRQLVEYFELN